MHSQYANSKWMLSSVQFFILYSQHTLFSEFQKIFFPQENIDILVNSFSLFYPDPPSSQSGIDKYFNVVVWVYWQYYWMMEEGQAVKLDFLSIHTRAHIQSSLNIVQSIFWVFTDNLTRWLLFYWNAWKVALLSISDVKLSEVHTYNKCRKFPPKEKNLSFVIVCLTSNMLDNTHLVRFSNWLESRLQREVWGTWLIST